MQVLRSDDGAANES